MAHQLSRIDDSFSEVYRTAGHIVSSVCNGDNVAAADLIQTFDNQQDLCVVLAAALSAALPDDQDARNEFIDRFFWADESHTPVQTSKRAQACELLLSELMDGKRHLYVRLRALAISQGLSTRDLANAARYLDVKSGKVNGKGHWYWLPPERAKEARSRASKRRTTLRRVKTPAK